MGLTFTKLFARLFSKKEMRILMVSAGGGAAGGRARVAWSQRSRNGLLPLRRRWDWMPLVRQPFCIS